MGGNVSGKGPTRRAFTRSEPAGRQSLWGEGRGDPHTNVHGPSEPGRSQTCPQLSHAARRGQNKVWPLHQARGPAGPCEATDISGVVVVVAVTVAALPRALARVLGTARERKVHFDPPPRPMRAQLQRMLRAAPGRSPGCRGRPREAENREADRVASRGSRGGLEWLLGAPSPGRPPCFPLQSRPWAKGRGPLGSQGPTLGSRRPRRSPRVGGPVHVLGGADVGPCARSSQLRPGSRQALGGGAGPAAHVRARFPRPRPPQQKSPEAGSGFRT